MDEICAAWLATCTRPGEVEKVSIFRFDMAVHRRLPPGMLPQQMLQFDLSQCKLTSADLVPFEQIKRLNLSRNQLTAQRLKARRCGPVLPSADPHCRLSSRSKRACSG